MKLIILIALFAVLHCLPLQNSKLQPFESEFIGNLQQSEIPDEMRDRMIVAINNAFTFYQDDGRLNSMYISNQLEGTYSYKFTTILLEDQPYLTFSVYPINGIAIRLKGVNKMRINWYYIIWAVAVSSDSNYMTNYVESYQTGAGILVDQLKAIAHIIVSDEQGSEECTCTSVHQISQSLSAFDGQLWNIICRPLRNTVMHSNIVSKFSSFAFDSPDGAKCEYLVAIS